MLHAWLLFTFHDQQYGETRLKGNGETDQITKTVYCLHTDKGHNSGTMKVRYENEAWLVLYQYKDNLKILVKSDVRNLR